MKKAYLDWNVFNRIEKNRIAESKDQSYIEIDDLIKEGKIISSFSNAHINDLLRGYEKNPTFIDSHLNIIEELTHGLYICQYWGYKDIVWDTRNVREVFDEVLEDFRKTPRTFDDFLNKESTKGLKGILDVMKHIQLPVQFSFLLDSDPTFSRLFPKTKIDNTMFSFLEDIFEASYKSSKDNSSYIGLRNFFNQNKELLKVYEPIIEKLNNNNRSKYISDDLWNKYGNKNQTSYNPFYQELTNIYCKIDFRGENSDSEFPNLIDDALHVFYGAHCDFFISTDKKCRYKAEEAFKELGIKTKVFSPVDFIENFALV